MNKTAQKYLEHRRKMAARQKAQSTAARDIAPLPKCRDQELKDRCRHDLRLFCEECFPELFTKSFSPDHLKVLEKMQHTIDHGGLFALAMPRGSGKTTLCQCAVLWAALFGKRKFIALIGATASAASELLQDLQKLLLTAPLATLFPEVSYPIHKLEGVTNRCAGQLYNGKPTAMKYTSGAVVLPTIEGSPASGVIIRVAGITGRIRGMKYQRSDGKSVRPDLVIIDDPQTAKSASSERQTLKRLEVLNKDILGLAGPGQKIAAAMPCTVIRPGDMADQILDRNENPEWRGERCRLLNTLPTNTDLWEQYAEERAAGIKEDGTTDRGNAFYLAHRAEMDNGAEAAWEERYTPDEISAIQHAMNIKQRNEAAFWSEYQNEPMTDDGDAGEEPLHVEELQEKLSYKPRNTPPLEAQVITAMVDVQKDLLYYSVVAWSEHFGGVVIDYGAYPEQRREYFTLSEARPTYPGLMKGESWEAALYAALTSLLGKLAGTEYRREDGQEMTVERILVDANWGTSTDLVYQVARESRFRNIVLPSHGRFIGAGQNPISQYHKTPGMKLGNEWMIPPREKRATRHVVFDANYWKTFTANRLRAPAGDRASLVFFGDRAPRHRMICEHICAEYRVRTFGRGRTVDEWKLKPGHPDNHLLDCLVGCAVAASISGLALSAGGYIPDASPLIRGEFAGEEPVKLGQGRTTGAGTMGANKPSDRKPLKLSELAKTKNRDKMSPFFL